MDELDCSVGRRHEGRASTPTDGGISPGSARRLQGWLSPFAFSFVLLYCVFGSSVVFYLLILQRETVMGLWRVTTCLQVNTLSTANL